MFRSAWLRLCTIRIQLLGRFCTMIRVSRLALRMQTGHGIYAHTQSESFTWTNRFWLYGLTFLMSLGPLLSKPAWFIRLTA